MKSIRDTLYLITSYSIRSGFLQKAEKYTDVGTQMFPTDQRLLELRALVLLNLERFQEAEEIVSQVETETPNVNYIKVRTSILLNFSAEEIKNRVQKYLATAH